MDAANITLKRLSLVGLAVLLVLLAGGVIFYRERLFFADPSFIAFSIVNYKSLYIQEHRYGSLVTQLVPHLLQMWGVPLKMVLIAYAVSFNVFYLLVATLLFRLRQYVFVVLMALYFTLFVSESYFWMANEVHQAAGWMFLMWGTVLYLGHRNANMIITGLVFLLLAFLTVSTHMVIIIPTCFLFIYCIIERRNWPFSASQSGILAGLFLAGIALKFLLVKPQNYDTVHLYGITHVSFKDIFLSFSTPVVRMFLGRCLANYWIAVIVFAAGLAGLFKQRKWWAAAWVIMSAVGYIIIMGLTYGDLDEYTYLFHIESEWVSIGIIAAAPFVFVFLPGLRASIAVIFLVTVCMVRLCYIGVSVPAFTWRTHFEQQVLDAMKRKGISKLALIRNNEIRSKYVLEWGATYESLLISAANNDVPNRTFMIIDSATDENKVRELTSARGFYNTWNILPPEAINQQYFKIDTGRGYTVMAWEELIR